jgi:hypothetical protein
MGLSCGLIYSEVYIQNAANSHFINRWDGFCARALFEEPATLIFFGTQQQSSLFIGTLLRDLTATKLWEIVAVEEMENRGVTPSQFNTHCYVRWTRPPAAPGSDPPPSFSRP